MLSMFFGCAVLIVVLIMKNPRKCQRGRSRNNMYKGFTYCGCRGVRLHLQLLLALVPFAVAGRDFRETGVTYAVRTIIFWTTAIGVLNQAFYDRICGAREHCSGFGRILYGA